MDSATFSIGFSLGGAVFALPMLYFVNKANKWAAIATIRNDGLQATSEAWRQLYTEAMRSRVGEALTVTRVRLPENEGEIFAGSLESTPVVIGDEYLSGAFACQCPACGGVMNSEEFELHRCVALGAPEWPE